MSMLINYMKGTSNKVRINAKSFAEVLNFHIEGGFGADELVSLLQELSELDADVLCKALNSRYLDTAEKRILTMLYNHYLKR